MRRNLRGASRCRNCDRGYDRAFEGGYKYCGNCQDFFLKGGFKLGASCRLLVQERRECACGCGESFMVAPGSARRFATPECAHRLRRPPAVPCSTCGKTWQPNGRQRLEGESRCGPCRMAAFNEAQRRTHANSAGEGRARPHIRRNLRIEVLEREACCQDCGRQGGPFHLHHVVPRSKGGPNTPENLKLLCQDCHVGVGWARNHPALVA